MRALTRGGRAFTAAALAAATAVLVGAAGLVAGGSGDARAAGGAVVLDEGELDFTPRLADGKLELQIDDRTGDTTVVREPSQVVLHAPASSLQYTPDPVATALGTTNMDSWQLNGWEAENIFAPEPGWNGSEAGGDIEVSLSGYDGPDIFGMAAYTRETDSVNGPATAYLGSAESVQRTFTLSGDEERLLPIWQFTAEGVYRLTFTVTSGGSSDTETLAVVVGDDVDPAGVLPGDGSTPTASPTDAPTGSATASPSPTVPAAHVIAEGHVDLAARPTDGDLEFQLKEGTELNHEWYEPGEIVMHVRPAAKRKIPEGYEFLGTPGDAVWWLPLQQNAGIVWPGWNTTEYAKADLDGRVSFRLDSVQGPGNFAMFYNDAMGVPVVSLNSGDGLPDTHTLGGGTHSHFDWVFSAEGVYRTTFTVSATLADGTKVSDTETIAWVVGDDTDPSTVTPGEGDEPTATPTATPSESASQTPTVTPSVSASGSASASAPATDPGTASSGSGGTSSTGGSGGSGTSTAGGLASTGAQVAVIAGVAVVALLVGGGAVFFVRSRRTAQ
ncbi:choice-of-anchor M domain-containing protein [Streptomyces himalayensis]|uniref:TIGR03769 domain-containing protein n=1 Tax=Streptomyces himalayensis subsp. himalayensis TaxID=2756131 RepID=A0A7W0DMA5_9ACTN|nr:choice-of-anchor M domain-containing protein [Streptomyces himalayensis]MBA2947620.1 TIGR03769 domain-containing protein [Streptomyces himalayensis subsp. himalayensis]